MSNGAVALITGAAGDIGRATALILAEAGWRVALTDRPAAADDLTRTAEQCAAGGADVWSETADVTNDESVVDLVKSCGDSFGTPTGLFANAGLQGRFERVDRYPLDELRQLLDVNVTGVFAVLSATAAAMVAHGGGGSVVLTASMAGVTGAPNMSAYSATKGAVIALAKSGPRTSPQPAFGSTPSRRASSAPGGCGTAKSPPRRRRAASTTPPTPTSSPGRCGR